MKTRIIALFALAIATIFVIAQSLPISQFPNTPTPLDSDLFVLAQTQAPKTNKNIRYDQLRGSIRSGMATESYVNNATNGLASTNYANQVASNRVVVLADTNTTVVMTSTNGTNFYAVSSSAGGAVLWTNSGGIVRLTTNGPVSIASTGLLGGLVVTQDMRILGHNSASNSVWVCTNATTGEGEWRTLAGAGAALLSDSLWTNAAGTLRPTVTNEAFIGGGSNNAVAATAGFQVIGGGSDNDIAASTAWATISGGFDNSILANTSYGTIGGGQQNTSGSNHSVVVGGAANIARGQTSVVVGGDNNTATHDYGIVVGGRLNNSRGQFSFIGGGSNNHIFSGSSGAGRNFIGGGNGNSIGLTATFPAEYSAIPGGFQNTIQNDCDYSFIGGGRDNTITGAGSTNGVIGGGAFNLIGNGVNRKFASILGGERNLANGDYSFAIGGASNNAAAARSGAIGMNVTNATAGSVTVGELISYNTPAVIAGAGSGSTNYLLAVTSPKMLLGSSNVHIYGVSGTIAGKTHNWSANITNLSAIDWGIGFSSGTNRWKFQSYMYGTSAPVVLTNNTLLRLNGASEGTNTLVTYEYFSPAL